MKQYASSITFVGESYADHVAILVLASKLLAEENSVSLVDEKGGIRKALEHLDGLEEDNGQLAVYNEWFQGSPPVGPSQTLRDKEFLNEFRTRAIPLPKQHLQSGREQRVFQLIETAIKVSPALISAVGIKRVSLEITRDGVSFKYNAGVDEGKEK